MELKPCSSSKTKKCCGHEKAKYGRDRISEMPDAILGHILSSIPTRDSVGTSTLSRRWRSAWTSVPVIDIDDKSLWHEYEKYSRLLMQSGFISLRFKDWFMNFVDRVLLPSFSLNYEVSCVRKLRLSCCNNLDLSRVGNWIKVVTRLDDLEELDLAFWVDNVKLPPSTFTCTKLVILKLARIAVLNFPSSVCLPSLKKLHLVSVKTLDVYSVEKILIGCPVLEELQIIRRLVGDDKMGTKTLCIQSSSLKSLTLISWDFRLLKLVIDASNLERLDLSVDAKEQVDVNCSLSSLVTAKLDIRHSNTWSNGRNNVYESNVLELLMKMSNTKYLCLSAAVTSCERLWTNPALQASNSFLEFLC